MSDKSKCKNCYDSLCHCYDSGGSFCFMYWCLIFLCCWRLICVFIVLVKVTEWPPIGKIAAHSAYDMFHGIST